MKQIIAYVRVSTRKQGTSGLGLEAQRDAIARFAGAERCDVVDTFTEVETGKGADALERRPQLAAALSGPQAEMPDRRLEARPPQPRRPLHQRSDGSEGPVHRH